MVCIDIYGGSKDRRCVFHVMLTIFQQRESQFDNLFRYLNASSSIDSELKLCTKHNVLIELTDGKLTACTAAINYEAADNVFCVY